ncbi:hypothetical protein L218DRAFT_130991 [Marasmius fiardii PR-910]|nr:hypothetical protein L218DRAFT_130991 [Marasmius fiardii PR-910]
MQFRALSAAICLVFATMSMVPVMAAPAIDYSGLQRAGPNQPKPAGPHRSCLAADRCRS